MCECYRRYGKLLDSVRVPEFSWRCYGSGYQYEFRQPTDLLFKRNPDSLLLAQPFDESRVALLQAFLLLLGLLQFFYFALHVLHLLQSF